MQCSNYKTHEVFSIHYKLFFHRMTSNNPKKHTSKPQNRTKTIKKLQQKSLVLMVANLWFEKANRSLRNDLPLNYQFGPGTPGKPWRRGNFNSIPDSDLTKVCSATKQILILNYFPFNSFTKWMGSRFFCETSISITYTLVTIESSIYIFPSCLNRRNRKW